MKKQLVLFLSVFLLCTLIYINPFQPAPFAPDIVTASGQKAEVVEGSYCWNSFLRAQCVDKVYTSAHHMASSAKVKKVLPGEVIEIHYPRQPRTIVELMEWKNEDRGTEISLEENQFSAPQEPGMYFYSIQSDWIRGDGIHAFRLEVVSESK